MSSRRFAFLIAAALLIGSIVAAFGQDIGGSAVSNPQVDASSLTTGELDDGRLSANVPLLDAANVFETPQTISASPWGGQYLIDTDAGADATTWLVRSQNGTLLIEACDDAQSTCADALEFDRSGATVTAARIMDVDVTPATGTFTASFDIGCTTTPTVTYDWVRAGNVVTIMGTSATGFTCTGDSTSMRASADLPAALTPAHTLIQSPVMAGGVDDGSGVWVCMRVDSSSNISYFVADPTLSDCGSSGWTASGIRNITAVSYKPFTYILNDP